MKKKILAFTLAETLITLAVIGVVAALTIPTLMQNWKDKQFDTARKKAMTTIANGYKLMIADNDGNLSNLPLFECGDDFSCLSGVHKKFFSIATDKSKTHDGLAEKYTKNGDSTEEAGFKWDNVPYIFTTSDGMTYGYLANGFDIVVDINGSKSPNKICKDVYKFSFTGNTVNDTVNKDGNKVALCEDLDDSEKNNSSYALDEFGELSSAQLADIHNSSIQCGSGIACYQTKDNTPILFGLHENTDSGMGLLFGGSSYGGGDAGDNGEYGYVFTDEPASCSDICN